MIIKYTYGIHSWSIFTYILDVFQQNRVTMNIKTVPVPLNHKSHTDVLGTELAPPSSEAGNSQHKLRYCHVRIYSYYYYYYYVMIIHHYHHHHHHQECPSPQYEAMVTKILWFLYAIFCRYLFG